MARVKKDILEGRDPNETGRIHHTGLIAEDGSEITLLLPDSEGAGSHGIQIGAR